MVNLALICSFSRMRSHLGLGSVKREEIPNEILRAVAEILRGSTFVKLSDDGRSLLLSQILNQLLLLELSLTRLLLFPFSDISAEICEFYGHWKLYFLSLRSSF